jgi:hypothetical protein
VCSIQCHPHLNIILTDCLPAISCTKMNVESSDGLMTTDFSSDVFVSIRGGGGVVVTFTFSFLASYCKVVIY